VERTKWCLLGAIVFSPLYGTTTIKGNVYSGKQKKFPGHYLSRKVAYPIEDCVVKNKEPGGVFPPRGPFLLKANLSSLGLSTGSGFFAGPFPAHYFDNAFGRKPCTSDCCFLLGGAGRVFHLVAPESRYRIDKGNLLLFPSEIFKADSFRASAMCPCEVIAPEEFACVAS